jgi:hypothetical protein
MALKQRSEQRKYVRIKNGKIFLGKDFDNPYDELEGTITSMYFKDEEYNGAPLRKLIVVLSDEEDNYQLSINTESNSYGALVSFLSNVDLARPVTLVPMEETITKDGSPDVQKRTILVSQDGKFAKGYFTKEEPHGLPRWDSVTVGKKKVLDKTAYLEFLEDYVVKTLVPRIKIDPTDVKSKVVSKPTSEQDEVLEEVGEEEPTKMPWD